MVKNDQDQGSERINLRLPPALFKNVLQLGEALGYNNAASAARYFLTVGIQQSMAQINSGRIHADNSRWQAQFPDMFSNVIRGLVAEDEAAAKGRVAGPASAGADRSRGRKK